jgi:hypothetical protein
VEPPSPLGRVLLQGYAQVQLFLYANGHGYRAGNRLALGASAGTAVAGRLHLSLGADVLDEQPERWGGEVKQDGNVGRTDVLVGGIVAYPLGPVSASLAVKVPVLQRFTHVERPGHDHEDPGQLRYPGIVTLGLQHTFGRR